MKEFGYSRLEKLKQKKEITQLFANGKWKSCGTLRMILTPQAEADATSQMPNKIGVSVSKRFFKKAVDRNRIKRLLREAYRLHKPEFEAKWGRPVLAMLFWNSPQKPAHFKEVEEAFLMLCQKK